MKHLLSFLLSLLAIAFPISAQVGYQVSLLNNATGEPRANERVSVTVKITDSEGKTVCEETKYETSNDFGVISMSIGNSDTFSNADWSKLPFFIEASVDGRLLGKSQLLSVPIAQHAVHTGSLTIDILCSKEWMWQWRHEYSNGYMSYKFFPNGTCVYSRGDSSGFLKSYYESYFVDGNDLIIYSPSQDEDDNGGSDSSTIFKYNPYQNRLFHSSGEVYE